MKLFNRSLVISSLFVLAGVGVTFGANTDTSIQSYFLGPDSNLNATDIPLIAIAGEKGADGAPGADGADGAPGADGVSPTVVAIPVARSWPRKSVITIKINAVIDAYLRGCEAVAEAIFDQTPVNFSSLSS